MFLGRASPLFSGPKPRSFHKESACLLGANRRRRLPPGPVCENCNRRLKPKPPGRNLFCFCAGTTLLNTAPLTVQPSRAASWQPSGGCEDPTSGCLLSLRRHLEFSHAVKGGGPQGPDVLPGAAQTSRRRRYEAWICARAVRSAPAAVFCPQPRAVRDRGSCNGQTKGLEKAAPALEATCSQEEGTQPCSLRWRNARCWPLCFVFRRGR